MVTREASLSLSREKIGMAAKISFFRLGVSWFFILTVAETSSSLNLICPVAKVFSQLSGVVSLCKKKLNRGFLSIFLCD